jgi:hypothetical protein
MRTQVYIAGVPTTIRGVNSLDFPPVTAEMADSSSFENNGYASNETVAGSWTATLGIWRRNTSPGVYYAEHEYLRLQAFALFNNANRLEYRFYDIDGGPEAYHGFAYTTWKNDSGDWKALQHVTVTLAGDGAMDLITNPLLGSQVPLIASALPTAQTAGNQVTVMGQNFTGTTGITVNAVSVGTGKFTVLNDNTIVFVMPAGSAGAGNIIVTNAAGASTSFTYTRGA